jgi:hypothetical protein
MNKTFQRYLLSTTLLIISSFSVTSIAKETMYKWIDGNGVTHYSANRPQQQAAEKMVITVNSPSESVQTSEKKITPISVAPPIQASQKNPQKCATARSQHQMMAQHARIRSQDELTGEWYFLSENEKQTRLTHTKKQIQLFCD